MSRSDGEGLYRRHAPTVYRYLVARAGPGEAEDLLSDTFVGALCSIDKFDPDRGTERAWVLGIATNVLRSHTRASVKRVALGDRLHHFVEPAVDVLAGDRADAEALARRLAPLLLELPDGDLDILLLHAWADLEPTEIATALALRPGTVRSKLHRLRAKLAAAVSDEHAHSEKAQQATLFSL